MKPKYQRSGIRRHGSADRPAAERRAEGDALAVYGMLEAMIARVNTPMPREAEPAHIFIPEVR